MSAETHRVVALPGDGAVVRTATLLAIAAQPDGLPEGPGLPTGADPVAAIWWAEDGRASYMSRGGATISVDGAALPEVADPTPLDIPEAATVRLTLPDGPVGDPPTWGNLRDAVVAAAAAVMVPLVDSGAAVEPPAVGFDWVDLREAGGAAQERPALAVGESGTVAGLAEPGAMVEGILCSRDHFNNPSAAYCQVCGISMVHLTHGLVTGVRPTMGFLVFDNGATYALDRDYVAGRAPDVSGTHAASPLTILDDELSVSGTHARIDLSGWDVVLHDLGSTNGTFIWDAAHRQWNHVPPNTPTILAPGSTAAFGRQTFVFESAVRGR